VTLSVDGKDNRLNGVTTVNEAHVVNVSNTFYGEDSHRKTAKTGSELVGRWKGTTRQAFPDAEITTDGYMQFLQNGAYSFSGECIMRWLQTSGEIEAIVWKVAETGSWSISDNTVLITANDLKSLRTVLHRRDETVMDIDRDVALAPPGMPPPPRYRLEDLLPKGASQEYVVSELTATTLRAAGQDMRGARVEIIATRQP
jgi:hypothetical protein